MKTVSKELLEQVETLHSRVLQEWKEVVSHNARLLFSQFADLESITLVGYECSNDEGGSTKFVITRQSPNDTLGWRDSEVLSERVPACIRDKLPYSWEGKYDSDIVEFTREADGSITEKWNEALC